MSGFAGLDVPVFLRDYWQRQPLLLRAALPDFRDPVTPEELAGLALEAEVDSRIVTRQEGHWHAQPGPFQADSFALDGAWTLLVQSVDHYLPSVGALKSLVDFLPSWRFDDVMVSFASAGGGVGPHYDNYDVFLLQGQGSRRWQLGGMCSGEEPLAPAPGLRVLDAFDTRADYILEPGDVLYVPPGLAHWGTACEPCMTYSLGFRAPRLNDLVSRRVDAALELMDTELLYRDAPLTGTATAGEITGDQLNAALRQLQTALADTAVGADWFGEVVTGDGLGVEPDERCLQPAARIRQVPGARVAWHQQGGRVRVYANGETCLTNADQGAFLQALCRGKVIDTGDYAVAPALLAALVEIGCIEHA